MPRNGRRRTSAKPLSTPSTTSPSVGSSPTRGNSGGDLRRDKMTEKEEIEQLGDVEVEFDASGEDSLELYVYDGDGSEIYSSFFVDAKPAGDRVGEEMHRANAAARGYVQAIEDVVEIMEDEG